MRRLYLLTFLSIVAAWLVHRLEPQPARTLATGKMLPASWLQTDSSLSPSEAQRPPDQTFLTYPEWFLVFSPEEQATWLRHHTATSFPYRAHISQFWESYAAVQQAINGHFAPNPGYHFMIRVIGYSTSVEYFVKAAYERSIGCLTDTGIPVTEEDSFAAAYLDRYVTFIKAEPWYRYDFASDLRRLWSETPAWGTHPLRKWERRYFLSTELLAKIAYGRLIELGTGAVYEEALPATEVLAQNGSRSTYPVKSSFADGSQVLLLPRYDRFRYAADTLAFLGYDFREIAGNRSAILFTVLAPRGATAPCGTGTVFIQPVASDPSRWRMALAVPVPEFGKVLRCLPRDSMQLEHVFDY